MTRFRTLAALCVTTLVTSAAPALAQGPVITSPTPGQVFRAGPDYASDILHDPWDFSNVDDVSAYPFDYLGWAQSANASIVGPAAFGLNGRFIGTNASNDPAIGLLYAGGVGLPNPVRNGQRYPVATGVYGKLAFRVKATNIAGSQAAIHWFHGGVGSPAGTALSPVAVTNGEAVYLIDLVANYAGGPQYGAQSAAAGLRLDPINEASGGSIELDWVRLTARDNSPSAAMMTIGAAGCGGPVNVDVQDTSGLWATVGSSLAFNYGVLPPGIYNLRIRCNGVPSAPVQFTINDPPRVTVLQPDERGGADYATTVLNNAWNYDHPADIAASFNVQFLGASNGQLHARNTGPSLGDPQLFFLNREGSARPIATSRYRYLTYSLGVNAPFMLTGTDGSVARVIWGSDPVGFDGNRQTTTKDILVFPGFRTYSLDLASLGAGNFEPCSTGSCLPWTARSVRFFRFDPLEFGTQQADFLLGTVTLAAPDEVLQGGVFPIQWNVAGAGAGSIAHIYLDANAAPGGEALIGSVAAGAGVFNWQANVPPGDYYVYVQVVEPLGATSDVRGAYSTGVVRVIGTANSPVVTIATQSPGSSVNTPFTIAGCAYNAATGGAAPEVFVYAHPLQGQAGGVAQILGYNPAGGMGTASAAPCASGPGYQVTNIIGLPQGAWTFRTIARNTVTGDFDEVQVQNVTVSMAAGAARNFRTSVTGNTVALAWEPPSGGAITQYRIEAAPEPTFAVYSWAVLPPTQTSVTATLPNGVYYMRVRTGNTFTTEGPTSNVVHFVLPNGGGGVSPPGAITLGGQLNANPVSLNWSQAGGGAATYTLHAGSAPGQSNVAVVPMGSAMGLPPVALPVGTTLYVRIVASNAAGSRVSNEVVVSIPAPGPPGGPPIQLDPIISGRTVTLRWNAPAGGAAPTSYALVGRVAGSQAVIATAPGITSTSLTVSGVPPGNFVVTVVALYGATPSIESNPKAVNVR